ncbi:DDE-type integrase/transposase/recombinase [Pseudomonas sp. B21-059]|uniref:Mu transposase C-terminal domain-containing protein n=1 Tax=Pseudomonas sp. B21-059 TaxID=2895496 RepID=UPI0022344EC8|nr:Mu transposase C-terminal domain-containing protein [Pseudomonas sp. B21-059]UZE34732.1 DDE-type integrase/transposase/recombinase [Pseudomonas sp. B21-059]
MKTIKPGQLVYWRDSASIVVELKGLIEAVIRSVEDSSIEVVRCADLKSSPEVGPTRDSSHLTQDQATWDETLERFAIIKPLLQGRRSVEDVKNAAERSGKSVPTIYRWLKRYEETNLVSSLSKSPRFDKGQWRLPKEVQDVIDEQIEAYYLKKERRNVTQLHTRIREICKSRGLPEPHLNTIYGRVSNIEDGVKVRRRYGSKAYRDNISPTLGEFPGGDYPNAVVQIDHTPVDVIIVDEQHRLPIGRPYLTIAIDVATKMVTGFCLTLEPPSALSAGLCIAHAVQEKSNWLAKRDILAEWPIHGKMAKIHVDNAKEFRGTMLQRACALHDIVLEYRPRHQPNYGPHVERAFRTFMTECHTLEGTTFSNVKAKADYNSEQKACLTLDELELWFTTFFVYSYHNAKHSGNGGIPPIKKFAQLVYGSDTQLGVGLPARVEDEETFRLDFTPYLERTIQQTGALVNYIHYYSPVLRKWIKAIDQNTNKAKKFIFAYDPRDISVVYFLDPDTKTYVPIPYLNSARPAISYWELKAALKRIKNDPSNEPDEEKIFHGVTLMRKIEENAIESTRLAKAQRTREKRSLRNAQRRRQSLGVHQISKADSRVEVPEDLDPFDEVITPFDDIELG